MCACNARARAWKSDTELGSWEAKCGFGLLQGRRLKQVPLHTYSSCKHASMHIAGRIAGDCYASCLYY